MIDQQQQIDHAEHDAVAAEARAEHEAEQAHLAYVAALVAELRSIATDARDAGLDTAQAITDELLGMMLPNAHRHELLGRQQHTAALASLAADAANDERSYGVLAAVERAVADYLRRHTSYATPGSSGHLDRAAQGAATLVLAVARRAAAYAPSEAPTVPGRAGR